MVEGTRERLEAVRDGSVTAAERTEELLEAIKASELNAYISVDERGARAAAAAVDKTIAAGRNPSPMAGLGISLKDNIAVRGLQMTCASRMLADYIAPYDATVTKLIRDAGAIILGKANMDEFACGSSGETSAFGPTLNPRDPKRVPGGSSSGSCATVGGGLADLSVGTDTGGSIRCPAAFCGAVGIKPTYGLVSRYGMGDMAMSLEGPGPVAPDVFGAALLLSVLSGADPADCVTSEPGADYTTATTGDAEGLRVGLVKEFIDGVDAPIARAIKEAGRRLEKAGAELVELTIPSVRYAVPMYYIIMFSEFSSAMAKFDGFRYGHRGDADLDGLEASVSCTRSQAFGREVKRRILLGTYVTMREHRDAWYTRALRARSVLRQEFLDRLEKADVLLGATMPCLPWKLGELVDDPVAMYLMDIMTVSANLAGVCAGTVPVGEHKGLPTAVQLHCGPFDEGTLVRAMSAVEGGR